MRYNNAGIDTIEKEYKTELNLQEYSELVNGEYSILGEQIRHTKDKTTKIPYKPSHFYDSNKGYYLTNIEDSLKAISELEKRFKLDYRNSIVRIDIAFDSDMELENLKSIMLLLLECLGKELGTKEVITTKAKKDIKNIKLKSKDIEITCYNCKDKKRVANTRLEIRFLNIQSKMINKRLINAKLKEIKKMLNNSLRHLEEVEESYFNYIARRYKEQNLYAFYIENRDLLLTSRISKVVFDSLAVQKSYKRFLEVLRSKIELNFITRKELKDLVQELKSLIDNLIFYDKTSINFNDFRLLKSA